MGPHFRKYSEMFWWPVTRVLVVELSTLQNWKFLELPLFGGNAGFGRRVHLKDIQSSSINVGSAEAY